MFQSPLPASDHGAGAPLLLCFSHLRWDFVFQRPQHLMTRFTSDLPVLFWEEPILDCDEAGGWLETRSPCAGITVITPHVPRSSEPDAIDPILNALLVTYLRACDRQIIRWYYTPMMLPFSRGVKSVCTVYDCMDELSNFDFAPPSLPDLERELFACADLVFTGGYSLYEAKRSSHPAVYPFPSSVERSHFEAARADQEDPADQAMLSRPRLGYYGVIDERMDLKLVARIADQHPDWSIVMVGPVVKIDPESLPQRSNIFYLGSKIYGDLPRYVAGWDVALMPFAINASTRFISPTKTPEYLAAGLPVVSTPIVDVLRHYGELDAVQIASNPDAFIEACERTLGLTDEARGAQLALADAALSDLSWDSVVASMRGLMGEITERQSEAVRPHYDYLVVGAGFAGAVMAERLAVDAGKRVLVIDRRPHIGGNAYDHQNEDGILVHRYGPHIFHTNSMEIVDYLSHFTDWRPYEHRVLAAVSGQLLPMPINRTTLNRLYGLSLATDEAAERFLKERAEEIAEIRTSADVVISKVGRALYETFFRGYTRKQWGMDPSELDRSVTARVPTRTSTDDRYFTDSFQAMPARGYTAMFQAMLDHPNIEVALGVDFETIREKVGFDRLVFTGPIDEYFGHRYGKLPYRSLQFRHETVDCEIFQPVGVVNYPSEDVPYTRITEYKHLTGQAAKRTSITYEYPCDAGDPYYPVPRAENHALFKRYEALALGTPEVIFVGRLATYRYYNMDQVVGQALATYRRHREQTAHAPGVGGSPAMAP